MNLPFFIARRYFRAKKTPLVRQIGRVAVLSIAVSTAAMVLILSVMNGMNRFVAERFWGVDPDLKIEAVQGKFFEEGDLLERVRKTEGVMSASAVIEDQALLVYGEQTAMVRLKGVDTAFERVSDILSQVYSGQYNLETIDDAALVLMGGGVYNQMQIPPANGSACRLYTVDADRLSGPFAMQQAVSSYAVYPSGLFSSIPEYDNQYLFCNLGFARRVFDAGSRLSAVEVKVKPGFRLAEVQDRLRQETGNAYVVKDRIEQQQTMFRSMKAEKLIVVAVFAFVMLIATFTMVANQMLLIYEKRHDIGILSSMGMRTERLQLLFLLHGVLVSLWGTLSGVFFGSLLTFGQQRFGWVRLGGGSGSYITDAYPVSWQVGDVLAVVAIGLCIGILASVLPLKQVSSFAGKIRGGV